MKIHLMSDLHVESHLTDLTAGGGRDDLLCLVAGDWANGDTIAADGYSKVNNPRGLPILAVRGNHDWYDLNVHHHDPVHRAAASAAGITLLDREKYECNGWTVLGCTLWSNFELYGAGLAAQAGVEASRCVNDFRYIRNGRKSLDPAAVIDMYAHDQAWLDQQLEACDPEKTIVMTHFGPHPDSVHPIYRDDPRATLLNPYYCNNTGLIEKHQPALWVHGHTHELLDYQVGRTQVFCNPRGYSGERKQVPFFTNFVIDLADGQATIVDVDRLESEDSAESRFLRTRYCRTTSILTIAKVGDGPECVPASVIDPWLKEQGLRAEFDQYMRARSQPVGGWWPMDVEQFLAKQERKGVVFFSADTS